jgi:hypothetical protein
MKYRKYRSRHNSLESIIRREHLSIEKHCARKDGILIQDTTTLSQWGGLRKCWKEYKIEQGEADTKKMEYYTKAIRKFQQELKTSELEFPQFGLLGRKMPQEFDSENYWPDSCNCAQIQKGLEDYRLQELADPFRIEREPDLRIEQEEYFRRIRQGFVNPGSYI